VGDQSSDLVAGEAEGYRPHDAMVMGYADPFETLFAFQRALENRFFQQKASEDRAARVGFEDKAELSPAGDQGTPAAQKRHARRLMVFGHAV